MAAISKTGSVPSGICSNHYRGVALGEHSVRRQAENHVHTRQNLQSTMPGTVTASTVDQVMLGYQQSLLLMASSFLRAQEQVMLSYLRGTGATLTVPLTHNSQPITAPVPVTASAPVPVPTPGVLQFATPKQAESANEYSSMQTPQVDTPTAAAEHSVRTHEGLVSAFIDLVSQRTGYPVEMLDPSLDLETDLGVDSIKRVEILSNFKRLLPEGIDQQFEGSVEQLASMRTLQEICDWIRQMPPQICA